jgi:hypothetical protein
MAISEKLFLAILAMDAYNRGYNSGFISNSQNALAGIGGIQIGNANVGSNSGILGPNVDVSKSFFAQSYTWSNKTVISYRGTDDILGGDLLYGWSVGAGSLFGQVELARNFFQTVTGQSARLGQKTPCDHVFHMA